MGFRTAESAPAAPGDIRAFDVHTGKQALGVSTPFRAPASRATRPGPPTHWKTSAALANNWTGMVLDEKHQLIFAPTGSAVSDFYGYDRIGNDLYANTLLALDANTGTAEMAFPGHASRCAGPRFSLTAGLC